MCWTKRSDDEIGQNVGHAARMIEMRMPDAGNHEYTEQSLVNRGVFRNEHTAVENFATGQLRRKPSCRWQTRPAKLLGTNFEFILHHEIKPGADWVTLRLANAAYAPACRKV